MDTKDYINEALAAEMTAAYNKRRLSQKELSKRTDIPIATLQRLLTGKYDIRAEVIVAVAQAVGEDPAELMRRSMEFAQVLLSEAEAKNVTSIRRNDDGAQYDEYAGDIAANRDAEANTDE